MQQGNLGITILQYEKTQIFNLRLLKITCNRIIKLLVLLKIKQALRDDKGLN